MVYYRWKIDAGELTAYLPVLLACAFFILCWRYRHGLGAACVVWGGMFCRHLVSGTRLFRRAISDDVAGFGPSPIQTFDLHRGARDGRACHLCAQQNAISLHRCRPAFGLVGPDIQSRAGLRHGRGFLRDTLAKNPAAWAAHNDLGVILAKGGDYADAINHFPISLQFNSDNADAHLNLAHALALQGKFAAAKPQLLAALQIKPYDPAVHREFARFWNRRENIRRRSST